MVTFYRIAFWFALSFVVCSYAIMVQHAYACNEHDITVSYDASNESECDLTLMIDGEVTVYHLTAYDDGQCWYVAVGDE